jgi:hypothetical protein
MHDLSRPQAERSGVEWSGVEWSALAPEEPQVGDTPKAATDNAVRSFKQAGLPLLAFRWPTGSFRAPGASATCQ